MTKNFTLAELTNSITAKTNRIDNTPNSEQIDNLELLAKNTLQPIRDLWGKQIYVNSAFRSTSLNKAIGGVSNSQHLEGKAADITTGSNDGNKDLFNMIKNSDIPFDQLIDESNYRWIHVSYNKNNNRKQELHL